MNLVKYAIVWRRKLYTFWAETIQEALDIAISFNGYEKANGLLITQNHVYMLPKFKQYKEVRLY